MKRILLNQDIRPLSELGLNAASFIEQVRESKRPIVITQDGKSAAVLLDVLEYEALLEKLEIFQDVHQAEIQLREGKGVEHEVAKGQVLARLDL
jgi:prevent-host-death family protein